LNTSARFTLGIRAKVQPKSSIPIGAKVEISPKGFTLGVKAELEKIFSICPNLLINAELYGLILARRLEKRIPSNLGVLHYFRRFKCTKLEVKFHLYDYHLLWRKLFF
jgi:hypothetical protein